MNRLGRAHMLLERFYAITSEDEFPDLVADARAELQACEQDGRTECAEDANPRGACQSYLPMIAAHVIPAGESECRKCGFTVSA